MPRTRGLECVLLGCLLGCAKPAANADADATEGDESQYEFLRLDATSYVVRSAYDQGNDAGSSESGEGFLGLVVPESALMECDAAASDQARFDCLHKLVFKGEACTDPAALACP